MFINLTPHTITVLDQDSVLVKAIPPSGAVARLEKRDGDAILVDGIPVKRPHFGEVMNLPEPQDGIFFIVSAMVRTSPGLLSRGDLVSPADFVRDSQGNIVGCRAFDAN